MVPVPPAYGDAALGALLPGIAAALGAPTGLPAVFVPPTDRICLVLIDGLGDRLLAENRSSAPFLSRLRDSGRILQAGCPATTATSMGSLGTGRPPGEHGLVGYGVLDPARQVLLNELSWHRSVDPLRWQPFPTVFEHLQHAGIAVTTASDPAFAGSGLTVAALRGGAFFGSAHLPGRIAGAVHALTRRGLVYLYWPDVDTAGHLRGCRSPQWRAALRYIDRQLGRLALALPAGTVLMVTADHGMVDVPHLTRLDLAYRPGLAQGVRLLGVTRGWPSCTACRTRTRAGWPCAGPPPSATGPGCGRVTRPSSRAGSAPGSSPGCCRDWVTCWSRPAATSRSSTPASPTRRC